jgi:hypothetical protein
MGYNMAMAKITDIQPQQKNVNLHKEHGERLLRKSVQDYGIGDGITIAANDEAISGSMRIETLADMMPDVKIQIVETYGETLLVNKRMDIATPDTKRGRALSVASNQVSSIDWNPDGGLLAEWGAEDPDIKALFTADEWGEIMNPDEFDGKEQLEESEETIRYKNMLHVLISVPVNVAIDVKEIIETISEINGVEISYGAN